MFPFFWLWAPQVRLPFSGDVAQDIEPNLSAFFAGIKPSAGNARVEARAFDVATYGDQLGAITELLIQIAERQPADTLAAAAEPLKELRRIHTSIQKIKAEEKAREVAELTLRLEKLCGRDASA